MVCSQLAGYGKFKAVNCTNIPVPMHTRYHDGSNVIIRSVQLSREIQLARPERIARFGIL